MAEDMLEQGGFVRSKDVVGIVAGTATRTGATNFMRLHLIGDR
jgi:pyruvate kinase